MLSSPLPTSVEQGGKVVVETDGGLHRVVVETDGGLHRVETDGELHRVETDGELHRVETDGELHRVETDGELHRRVRNMRDAERTENLQNGRINKTQASEDTETIPYLTIGADSAKCNPDHHKGQRSQKAMVRVSTWLPTLVQWQAHNITQWGLSLFPDPNLDPVQEVKDERANQSDDPDPDQEIEVEADNQSPDPD
ncbi:unnamed protein product [Coregonus sp. 'balchen']|nr:unnamed protein product [Coregonus sp. 'balchen']